MGIKINKMLIDLNKINSNVGFFRFKKLENFYLLTNDIEYVKLTEKDFSDFLEGKLKEDGDVFKELYRKGFLKKGIFENKIALRYRQKNSFLVRKGVGLHIVVVTKRCNHLCVYCQAGSPELQNENFDMNEETAKKTVDLIFQTPNKHITIEFQGGEPLINWKVVKFIIEYANSENEKFKKNLNFALITNLSLMTEDIYDYLVKNNIGICTSLDGPAHVHNKNRPYLNKKNSYQIVTEWVETMRKKEKENNLRNTLSALPTLTRYSLEHIEEVIDEYIKINAKSIHLRQLSYLGNSAGIEKKNEIGYTAEEFIAAWEKGINYIIQKNKEGVFIAERHAVILLEKIFKERGNNFLDLRSPCGAGIGQLAYFYNGDVYSCDEGRMTGDDLFLLGSVFQNNYTEITECAKTKALVIASTLENFSCDDCAYKPYCGTCPVLNYVLYNNLFPNIRMTDKCKINMAILDYLFLKMEDEEVLKIFKTWIN